MTTPVTLRRYVLPSIKGEGWAIVVIGSDGYFSTVSDWGNYAYWWKHHGRDDFREFLAQVNGDYFASKVAPGPKHSGARDAIGYAKHVLPRLAEVLRAELAAERKTTP